jgi:two-component system sensor histidine kinase KdpD
MRLQSPFMGETLTESEPGISNLPRRGKLKVFFGASPGVGKTFAMLEEGRRRASEGLDVVVGYAEPHARPDTEALLLGMELLPYQFVDYKNIQLREFDLDAALKRKPALLLVDELAHTNAPGMRHDKRYQDVIEVLEAGIDVYTTLNVQHLESLNDIVEKITGVRVREKLPDSVLESADEVELVDISPEELIERLDEGKVYTGQMADRAKQNFFSKGNLLALRELALRRTAERVDEQMRDYRQQNAVRGPSAASDRILVCVSPSPLSGRLIRSAKRLAMALRAPWVAAYVETPNLVNLSAPDRQRIDQNMKLAEQLGAQAITLHGQSVADEMAAFASSHNITRIVIGKPERPRWREILFGSVVDDLIRRSGQIDVYVIRGESDEEDRPQPIVSVRPRWDVQGTVFAFIAVSLATALGWPLDRNLHIANTNVLMLYLLAVLWIALKHSRTSATIASVLSVAAFDFFFVPPFYSFAVSDQQYLFTFLVMLATALTVGTLTNRVRIQAALARERERRTQTLLAFSRDLASSRTEDQIARATTSHIGEATDCRAVVLLPDAEKRLVAPPETSVPALDEKELSVAQWVFEHDRPAGRGTGTLPAAAAVYFPLTTPRGPVGVVGIFAKQAGGELNPETGQLAGAFASQAALAVERAMLAKEARQAWERVEAEFLRNTLLSGVSHELRTPLAAITGAASALIETGSQLTEDLRRELLETIYSESERMERLISNLLDMTRLESGGLRLKQEWQPVQDVVGAALRHLDRRLRGRKVRTSLPEDLPLVNIDGVGIEQVLTNLIDNAVEYSPADSPIEISARCERGSVVIEVADRGPGLPAGVESRIFEKFFRAHPDQTRRGIGLGLAISKGLVEAHQGSIAAMNRPDGGALFRVMLPATKPPTCSNSEPD